MTISINRPTKEELTSKGFTNRIRIHPDQTKDSLLKYGFTNFNKPTLYYMKMIDHNTSFNLSVAVDSLEITSIDILDENFGQPYDYQCYILNDDITSKVLNTYNKVNNILSKLQKDGTIIGFERGMYI